MGVDYTCACHTCRVYTPFEKYTFEYVKKFFEAFKKRHEGHNTQMTSDYDEAFDYVVDGWNKVEYIGHGSYKVSDKGDSYQFVSDEEIKEIAREVT